MLANKTIIEFLDETASNKPVPGGGSIAANTGATAAALTEMVANLTIGKKGYEAYEDEMKEIIKKASIYRQELIEDIDRDSDAFNDVMIAFKLPKRTDEEKANRRKQIQTSMKQASIVPLEVARKSYDIILLAKAVVKNGNKNAVTDGAVSAMMARTAVLSALYNVKINLSSIKDEVFVTKVTAEVNELETNVMKLEHEILKEIV